MSINPAIAIKKLEIHIELLLIVSEKIGLPYYFYYFLKGSLDNRIDLF